jgi:hypothetical protein
MNITGSMRDGLEVTIDDAPSLYRSEEAQAWVSGYDAGVIAALAACADLAVAHGGADGLIISTKIRNLLLTN